MSIGSTLSEHAHVFLRKRGENKKEKYDLICNRGTDSGGYLESLKACVF